MVFSSPSKLKLTHTVHPPHMFLHIPDMYILILLVQRNNIVGKTFRVVCSLPRPFFDMQIAIFMWRFLINKYQRRFVVVLLQQMFFRIKDLLQFFV
jgi:hypothetical protein